MYVLTRPRSALLLLPWTCLVIASTAAATPEQTFGAGSAVTSPDLSATFDSIQDGVPLSLYQEGRLTFVYGGSAACQPAPTGCNSFPSFSAFEGGFFYGPGNNTIPLIIGTDDGSSMEGIEFILASGFAPSFTGGYWEAYNNGVLTGASAFSADSIPTVFGLSDPLGFDELRIAMFPRGAGFPCTRFGCDIKSVAIDNVVVQLVPEPGTAPLLMLALACTAAVQRRRF